jgi:hypothetical protein
MQTQYEKDKAAVAAKEQRDRNLVLLRNFLELKHPEIKPGIAIDNLFADYMDLESIDRTDSEFEFALSNLQSRINSKQHVPTVAELKAQLIDKILELLNLDAYQSKNERQRMQFWTLEQLSQRLENAVSKKQLANRPLHELHEIARGTQEIRPYPGYATLASSIVPRGQIVAIKTRDYLDQLGRTDLHAFKKMVEVYGSKQIDDIRFGRRYGN